MDLEKELACSVSLTLVLRHLRLDSSRLSPRITRLGTNRLIPRSQICTELLYNPLTLLDCLHTFCGACLKEWFEWQADAARRAPDPPAPGASVFTCPSCRASVRDTRHNSTVASLLDMVLVAQPEKVKPQHEKEEMDAKYKPGDKVLPDITFLRRTAEQLRADERDRHLIDEVREMSLREAVHGSSSGSRTRRRRDDDESRSRAARRRAPRETSASREHSTNNAPPRERTHRRRGTGGDVRRRAEQSVRLSSDAAETPSDNSRTSSSGSRQMSDELLERQRRQIEHQSSLRSLISSSDAADIDMEREVEEFARQIQEEGLLDGLDLENIDLTNNDELSRRITEAYRRRQRERERLRRGVRERGRASSQHSYSGLAEGRPQQGPSSSRLGRPTGNHSRTPSTTSQSDERSRPPLAPSSNSNHLDVHDGQRRRRRTGSHSRDRSATVPIAPTQSEMHIGARSQTDLEARSNSLNASSIRPMMPEARSVSTNDVPATSPNIVESPPSISLPFSARVTGLGVPAPSERTSTSTPPEAKQKSNRTRPREIIVEAPQTETEAGPSTQAMPSLLSSPPLTVAPYKSRSSLFKEPSIACNRCGKEDIQYELHYNCGDCQDGHWNMCLSCYRLGKGCLHWFGFGYASFHRWERRRRTEPSLPEPHKLLASRFLRPKAMIASSVEHRQAWSTEDPYERLQSGTFCAQCFAWSNECYWRCDHCNEGDWGFCNDCVNQGRSCSHALLPLTHQATAQQVASPPPSPHSPSRPSSATMMVGLNATSIGPFKVMTFITTCDICRSAIAPTQSRFHCFECISSIVPDSSPGDYDICEGCYHGLVRDQTISRDNGAAGWRRCPQGHRMVIVGFQEGKGGQKRYVVRDLVGGRRLTVEPFAHDPRTQRWTWYDGDEKRERLVARDVGETPSQTALSSETHPPDGGCGWRTLARWAWYPAADANDELLFPKGAAISEVEDANGEWFHGVYMGNKGLFPAPYVRMLE